VLRLQRQVTVHPPVLARGLVPNLPMRNTLQNAVVSGMPPYRMTKLGLMHVRAMGGWRAPPDLGRLGRLGRVFRTPGPYRAHARARCARVWNMRPKRPKQGPKAQLLRFDFDTPAPSAPETEEP